MLRIIIEMYINLHKITCNYIKGSSMYSGNSQPKYMSVGSMGDYNNNWSLFYSLTSFRLFPLAHVFYSATILFLMVPALQFKDRNQLFKFLMDATVFKVHISVVWFLVDLLCIYICGIVQFVYFQCTIIITPLEYLWSLEDLLFGKY